MVLHGIYALNHGFFISWKINTRNVGGGMRVLTAKKSAKSYLNIVRENCIAGKPASFVVVVQTASRSQSYAEESHVIYTIQ